MEQNFDEGPVDEMMNSENAFLAAGNHGSITSKNSVTCLKQLQTDGFEMTS